MHHPERWTFDWFYKRHDMDKADNRVYRQTETERRAEELHEGCRMPMEQARELAASEASPDWYARGQDWGLADALTAGQNGDWTLDDIARAFAAGAQAGTSLEGKRTHEIECRRVALEEQADMTAIHLARMQSALEQTATRSADYLRKAIKAEAKCEVLELNLESARAELAKVNNEFGSENADWPEAWRRVAEVKERAGRLWRDNETLRAALAVVVHDWTEQFERNGHLAPAWVKQAREALGPNAE